MKKNTDYLQSLKALGHLREAQYTMAHSKSIQDHVYPVIKKMIQNEIRQAEIELIAIIENASTKDKSDKEYIAPILDPNEFKEDDLNDRVVDNKLGL